MIQGIFTPENEPDLAIIGIRKNAMPSRMKNAPRE
jgi:hypothetical protein